MKGLSHPATAIALLALFVALSGTSLAAASYINGKHIKPRSIAENRLTRSAIKALRGARGAKGATGPTGPAGSSGPAGATGPQGVVTIADWSGFANGIAGKSTTWAFYGPTVTVTTSATQRATAAGSVDLQTNNPPVQADVAICYQAASGGVITELGAGLFRQITLTTGADASVADTTSTVPGAGTWEVGMCVYSNSTGGLISGADSQGWAEVTN